MKRILVLFGLCLAICVQGCNSQGDHIEVELKLPVTSPLRQSTTITRNYVCQIRSIRHIELRALEKGYLTSIYIDEGQFVKKDELLFQVMPFVNQAELDKAKAEASFAEIEYQNTKKLSDRNVVAISELSLAKATLDKAKANLNLAQVHLDLTQVKAPFDGIIGRFKAQKGSLLEEGDLLTTLSDNNQMWVYFNVPEAEYLDYQSLPKEKKPSQVGLRMANNKVYDHLGEITAIEADFNNETGNIAYRATFPNPDGVLRYGQTGNVLLDVELENALLIPQKAVFEVLDKQFVFVVDKDNKVITRDITILSQMQDIFAVKSGLTENDKILLEGTRKVRDGMTISPEYQEPTKVFENLKVYAE